jgi:general nucleoside transport system permease protein
MIKFRLEKYSSPYWVKFVIPFAAILVTFLITSIILIISKVNPIEAFYYFLIDPFSGKSSLIEIFVKTTPLFLTGIAVVLAFSSGYWNIGAEGQLIAGATAAAGIGMVVHNVSQWVGIPLMVIGGFLAGALWALLPAILKIKLSVDEIVTTLLMNSVVLFFVSFLLNGPWKTTTNPGWPQSPEISASTMFVRLIPKTRLHVGFLIALAVILIIWFIITKTKLGYQMRAVGLGKEAAHFSGIHINRTVLISALVSGGIAGIAGAGEVGGIHYHLIEALSSGLGYTGVIIATLSMLNPLAVIPSALFIGLIETGGRTVSTALSVPIHLSGIVEGLLLLIILGAFLFQNYRIRRVR